MAENYQFDTHTVVVFETETDLARAVTEYITADSQTVLHRQEAYFLAVSGGSTPRQYFSLLAYPGYRGQIAWSKVQLFFVDERYVPHTNSDSNFRMTREHLLDHVPLPADQVHAIPTQCAEIAECVEEYATAVATVPLKNHFPCFDLIVLGMGDDGHTASLFPKSSALSERTNTVASNYVEKLAAWRITLTYPVLDNARQLLVTVCGKQKANVLARIMTGHAKEFPIGCINNPAGIFWYVDAAAASELPL